MSMPEDELRRQMVQAELDRMGGTPTQQGPEGPAVSSTSSIGGIGPRQATAMDNLNNTANQVKQARLQRLADSGGIAGKTANDLTRAYQMNNFSETMRQQRLAAAERNSSLADARQRRSLADLAKNKLLRATTGFSGPRRLARETASVLPLIESINKMGENLTGVPVNAPQNLLETDAQRNLRQDNMQLGLGGLSQQAAALGETTRSNLANEQLGIEQLAVNKQIANQGTPAQQKLMLEQEQTRGNEVAAAQTTLDVLKQLQGRAAGTGFNRNVLGILGLPIGAEVSSDRETFNALASTTLRDALSALEGMGAVSNVEFETVTRAAPSFDDPPDSAALKIQNQANQIANALEQKADRFPELQNYVQEFRTIAGNIGQGARPDNVPDDARMVNGEWYVERD